MLFSALTFSSTRGSSFEFIRLLHANVFNCWGDGPFASQSKARPVSSTATSAKTAEGDVTPSGKRLTLRSSSKTGGCVIGRSSCDQLTAELYCVATKVPERSCAGSNSARCIRMSHVSASVLLSPLASKIVQACGFPEGDTVIVKPTRPLGVKLWALPSLGVTQPAGLVAGLPLKRWLALRSAAG